MEGDFEPTALIEMAFVLLSRSTNKAFYFVSIS